MWHASGRGSTESLSWALAERAMHGVGDPALGEWREVGRDGVMHIRRRLTDQERKQAGDLQVRDIRGTEEEARRLRRLLRDAPQLRSILERIR